MKKFLILSLALWLFGVETKAQLAGGTVCPDFTVTDVNGNQWNLYEKLDSDKRIILNLFAAWDASSWSYYQSGELQSLDSTYGSLGTEQVEILFIEVEESNQLAQLLGPANTSNDHAVATQGDWVTDNPFVVADSAAIGELLEIAYFPRVYYICPDRLIYTIGQYDADLLATYIMQPACDPAMYNVDPMISRVHEESLCETGETFLTVELKNFGLTTLTGATLQLTDGQTVYPFPWTGSLDTYQSEELVLGPLELGYKRNFELTVTTEDENPANSDLTLDAGVALSAQTIVFELLHDAWPEEISWHIKNEDGHIVHQSEDYIIDYQLVTDTLTLPTGGCYLFEIFDSSGDGIHGSQWGGFDGRCSLKSFNWQGELVYTIFDYDGSYDFSELSTSFEADNEIALSVETPLRAMTAFNAYPNPTNGLLHVQYTLASSEVVSIELRDITGRLLSQKNLGNQMPGTRQEQVSMEDLPAGIYMMSLKAGNNVQTTRVVKR